MKILELNLENYLIDSESISKLKRYFGKKEFTSIKTFSYIMSKQDTQELSWVKESEEREMISKVCFETHEKIEDFLLQKKTTRIEQSSIDSLMSNVDIVEVIGGYIELKKSGSGFKACCPFHGEKSPSFHVSPTKNAYKCFGCGVGGDAIKFVEEFKNRSFKEAVEEVAAIANFTLTYEDGSSLQQKPREKLIPRAKPFEFLYFDKNRIKEKVNLDEKIPLFADMERSEQANMIFTSIWLYSLHTRQWGKDNFLRGRGISDPLKLASINEKVGYLHKSDIPKLIQLLEEDYGLQALVECGIINDGEKKKFKHQTQEGFIVIPSFDLYSNMVTGLKLRNTKLEEWQDKSMKEPEMSCGRISMPLPYGLSYESLINPFMNFKFCEGSIDNFSLPTEELFTDISIPGVDGIKRNLLGLFKGRLVEIYYDQDKAGRRAAFGYFDVTLKKSGKTIKILKKAGLEKLILEGKKNYGRVVEHKGIRCLLNEAGAFSIIKQWNKKFGGDINEVKLNGNIHIFDRNLNFLKSYR